MRMIALCVQTAKATAQPAKQEQPSIVLGSIVSPDMGTPTRRNQRRPVLPIMADEAAKGCRSPTPTPDSKGTPARSSGRSRRLSLKLREELEDSEQTLPNRELTEGERQI